MGKLVFEHVMGHANNATYRKGLGYPLLIFGILTALNLDLVTPTNILRPLLAKMRISHKLYEGHHLQDVPLGEKIGKMKNKVPKTILEFKSVAAPIGQSSFVVLMKTELLDMTI